MVTADLSKVHEKKFVDQTKLSVLDLCSKVETPLWILLVVP